MAGKWRGQKVAAATVHSILSIGRLPPGCNATWKKSLGRPDMSVNLSNTGPAEVRDPIGARLVLHIQTFISAPPILSEKCSLARLSCSWLMGTYNTCFGLSSIDQHETARIRDFFPVLMSVLFDLRSGRY